MNWKCRLFGHKLVEWPKPHLNVGECRRCGTVHVIRPGKPFEFYVDNR